MSSKVKVIPVPINVSIMDPETKWTPNRIKYSEHAAYKELIKLVSIWNKCLATLVFISKLSIGGVICSKAG